jgi:hypothetical protein
VPLIPWHGYLNDNSVNKIPHSFRGKILKEATADSRPDSGTASLLFEINMWMWRNGRTLFGQISLDSVEKAVDSSVELHKKSVQNSAGIQGTWPPSWR